MNNFSRRSFLKLANRLLTFTGLAVILGPIVAYFYPPKLEETPSEPVLVGNVDEIPEGESKIIRFGRYPALIINTQEGLRAYSAICTHFACICKWNPELEQIVCPCHDGYFDPLDGHVISGPPPEPLEILHVEVVNNEIYVGGEA
ncbi:MAG: Rieske (2Fe-2S) protein [Anaerolineales bacterium]|nr:Rieske (2Fe-2S) protein [Anaerolineales bacterium]